MDLLEAEGVLNHAFNIIYSGTTNLLAPERAEIYRAVVTVVDAVLPDGYSSTVIEEFKKRLNLEADKDEKFLLQSVSKQISKHAL